VEKICGVLVGFGDSALLLPKCDGKAGSWVGSIFCVIDAADALERTQTPHFACFERIKFLPTLALLGHEKVVFHQQTFF